MIGFVLACALMLLVAVAFLARPLLHTVAGESRPRRLSVFVLTSVAMGLLATTVYLGNTNWPWSSGATVVADEGDATTALDSLRRKTEAAPEDLSAWLALGRAYVGAERFAPAREAYQRAYDLSHGQNVDAVTGLAEALILSDPTSVNGRVGLLIEEALKLQPTHPKALWYGGMIALQLENLPLARERFQAMLALNPPPQIRSLLERQIQDLTQQLGESAVAASPAAAASARKVQVKVSLAAEIQRQLHQPVTLFVLARNPRQPGAPLAVERHQSSELPLQVELTAADAMLPTRTLADAEEVEIVARLSASGMPTEQPGDYFGLATYSFVKQGEQGSVTIEIKQRVQ